jgi:post-segregation antitoxin (ccd killing protein)
MQTLLQRDVTPVRSSPKARAKKVLFTDPEWIEGNKEATEELSRRIEQKGMFSDSVRRF